MPPAKSRSSAAGGTTAIIAGPLARRPISRTQLKTENVMQLDGINATISGKRKADASPRNDKVKRSALGNLTNNVLGAITENEGKKATNKSDVAQTVRNFLAAKKANQTGAKVNNNSQQLVLTSTGIMGATQRPAKVMTRAASRAKQPNSAKENGNGKTQRDAAAGAIIKSNSDEIVTTAMKPKRKTDVGAEVAGGIGGASHAKDAKAITRRISIEIDQTECDENSLYMSASEEFSNSRLSSLGIGNLRRSISASTDSLTKLLNQTGESSQQKKPVAISSGPPHVPAGVIEFDRENWDDPIQVSHYTMDIFNYLKSREIDFQIEKYMQKQPHLTAWMRTLLVDWMVEVQETFELNHETLYLAVKIVDMYLSKVQVHKEKLQLVGAAALFLACKYDERTPPLIDDFLYICDGAYVQLELTRMEMHVFKTIGYDLGFPLSYRFLRRYARCAKLTTPDLTLARFILEFSLMNYETISLSDSKMAAACLYMALKMTNQPGWNKTLEFYSGYKVSDFISIVPVLNTSLHQKPREATKTVRNKYAHKIFHEVSKVPLLTNEKLLDYQD